MLFLLAMSVSTGQNVKIQYGPVRQQPYLSAPPKDMRRKFTMNTRTAQMVQVVILIGLMALGGWLTPSHAQDKGQELVKAAEMGDLARVKALIATGVDVNAKDKGDWTALMFASGKGNTDIVRALIEAKADVNAKDEDDNTALVIASLSGHTEIVKLLKQAGARE